MHQRKIFPVVCVVVGMMGAACGAGSAAPTVPTTPAPPTASITPRAEASRAVPELTSTPSPATPIPLPTSTPALPSGDGGPVPPGAIARLGIGSINAVDLSQDGQLLAVGTTAGMYVYDANTFKRLWVQAIEAPVKGVAWSPDSRLVAVWFDQNFFVRVYDGLTGTQQLYLEHSAFIGDVDWSPDGTQLAVGWSGSCACWKQAQPGAPDPRISVWDVGMSALVFTSELYIEDETWTPPVHDVEWSPDGSVIATVSPFARAGDDRATGRSNATILWDAKTGVQLHIFEQGLVHDAVFSPDGKMLATWTTDDGTDTPRGDPDVWLWDVAAGKLAYRLEGHEGFVYAAAWSPDGTKLASGAPGREGAETIVWDVRTGTPLNRLFLEDKFMRVDSLAWSSDGQFLISGVVISWSSSGVIVWDTASGKPVLEADGQSYPFEMAAWAPDSQSFVSASSNAVILRSRLLPEPLHTIRGVEHYTAIHNLVWLSDAALVATNSYDTVVEWDVPSRRPIQISDGADIAWEPDSAETSPDGALHAEIELIPIGAENGQPQRHLSRVIVKDANGAVLYEFRGPRADHLLVKWSPDGKRLAAAGGLEPAFKGHPFVEGEEENAVMVWDITMGQLLHTFLGHTGRVFSLAWSPDGSMLASGSADGTVILWDVGQ